MKILIYNDSRVFGGHEIMTARMANAFSAKHEVYFLYRDEHLGRALSDRVKKVHIKLGPNWSYGGLGSYNMIDIVYLLRILKRIKPDFSIISQGLIELGLKCAWASKLLRIKTISYIPLCFSLESIGAPCGKLRDSLSIIYYNLFDAFITVSGEQKELILSFLRAEKPIYILDNYVDTGKIDGGIVSRDPHDGILRIGLIGRIAFSQKAQDRAVEIAEQLSNRQVKFKFIIIGDGKDKDRLVYLINAKGLGDHFIFTGWVDKVEDIYSDLDIVLISSHFEGLPLVMLEALLLRIMVLAPDKGIFKEYLDEAFLYKNYNDAADKLMNMELLKKRFQEKIDELRNNIIKRHNVAAFENSALSIISEISSKNYE